MKSLQEADAQSRKGMNPQDRLFSFRPQSFARSIRNALFLFRIIQQPGIKKAPALKKSRGFSFSD